MPEESSYIILILRNRNLDKAPAYRRSGDGIFPMMRRDR